MNNNLKSGLSKLTSLICVLLVLGQVIVILGSWVWSAAMPESYVRSLLDDAGIRWLFGTFVANLSNPLLVWIIILDISFGMCAESGLLGSFKMRFMPYQAALDSQTKSGLRASGVLLVIEIAVVVILTLLPHAVLRSVTGSLFPSSFSVSIIPIVAFVGVTLSICYGLFSGTLHNYKDVVKCACHGGNNLKTILVIYVLAVELYYSIVYVLG